jgi:hypothetical protein
MRDEVGDAHPFDDTLAPPWRPSAPLHSQLLGGVFFLVFAAALSSAASALKLAHPDAQGFTLAHALGLASLFPVLMVARAYGDVAREVGSDGLRKSA